MAEKDHTAGFWQMLSNSLNFGDSAPQPASTPAMDSAPESQPQASYGSGGGGIHPAMYGGSYLSDGSKFYRGISGSGMPVVLSHFPLRMNARKAYHETPQARAVVDRMADTVADTGLRLEATPKARIIGITDEQAEEWGRDVEGRFDSYAQSKKQHRANNMTLYQSMRYYQIFQHRDNDIFVRLFYESDADLLSPLQFEFIDPNQIRGHALTSTFGQDGFQDGIDRDDRGREKAYKIWIRENLGRFKDVTIPAKSDDGKRMFMLHGFAPEYAGQGRGYSRLAHALQEFQNITDFTLASIQKAINQASFVGYVKPSADEDAPSILDEIKTTAGIGRASSQFGSNPVPSADAQNVTEESLRPVCHQIPEATLSQPGGLLIENLTKGAELKMLETKAPGDSFDSFVDSFTSYLSAAHSMPLEVLLMKFGNNFSASRAALLLFWRVVQIWRDEMAADFLNPIYEMWLAEEIAAGRIRAQGWSDPRLRAAWLNNAWIGNPAPDIDPSKTAKATKDYISIGALTGKRAARNLNGSDHTSNMATLKREFGEKPPPPWSKPSEVEPTQKENSDDGEED